MLQATSSGATISYTTAGAGSPLVLVHGSMLGYDTSWSAVREALEQHFTVHVIARRGRGESTRTNGHSVEDEAQDVAAVIDAVSDGGVNVLGHSYGAVCSLAAAMQSRSVAKLILYEPPKPTNMPAPVLLRIEEMGRRADWSSVPEVFLRDVLQMPGGVIEALKQSPLWNGMTNDSEASLQDFRALAKYEFKPERFRELKVSVLLLTGSDSPDELYQTSALEGVLPDCRRIVLEGQAHGAMLTAADLFVREVEKFLLEPSMGN